jgi:hypothetical protein
VPVGSPKYPASAGSQRVLICITPKSSDPSVLRCATPGAPPSTAWMDGSTRGGR